MRSILELRKQRAKLIHDAREILKKADEEKRELTAEERGNYDTAFGDATKLKERIDVEERQLAAELDLERSIDPDPPKPGSDGDGDGDGKPKKELRRRARPEYRAAFNNYLALGQRGLGPEEFRAIQADDDVKAGFLVAGEAFSSDLIKFLDSEVFVRQVANVLPPLLTAMSLGVPSLDTDISDADWTPEITAVTTDTALAVGKREFNPTLVSKEIKVSSKLIRLTSNSVESLVLDRLGYKFRVTQEKAFLTGTGASQPLGVFIASANGIPTSRDMATDNTQTAITADNLRRVKMSLKGGHRLKAQWMFHTDAVLAISLLKYADGKYIWTESLRVGEPDRLLGLPIMESEFAPNTFTAGLYVGILGNWQHYWIVDALDMQVQRLDEKYAGTNQVGFIGRMESDGMPVLAEAFARVTLAP